VVVAGLIEAEEGGPERSRSLATRGVRRPARWPAGPVIVPLRPLPRWSRTRGVVRRPGWDP
jgi:hypothetical protein